MVPGHIAFHLEAVLRLPKSHTGTKECLYTYYPN